MKAFELISWLVLTSLVTLLAASLDGCQEARDRELGQQEIPEYVTQPQTTDKQ